MSDQQLTGVNPSPGRASTTRSAVTRGAQAFLAGAIAIALVATGATTAQADIGGGGVGGGGTGGQGASDYWLFTGDNFDGINTPPQGWGADSINTFANAMEQQAGWANGAGGDRSAMVRACSTAIDQAIARSNGASTRARVIQVGTGVGYVGGRAYMGWGGDQARMQAWYQQLTDVGYWQGDLAGYDAAALGRVRDTFLGNVPRNPLVVCVALNEQEPIINYDLSISTDKSATFSLAGQTSSVFDRVNASTASPVRENVNAEVRLNWGGVEGNSRTVAKNVTIANSGTTNSPSFTPGDFGWASWPSGKFWFDVSVPRQGRMNAAVGHGGANDPRESWSAATTAPRKILTSGAGADPLTAGEVLTSGMFYNAEITARTNGYASSMTINDTVATDKVFIGSATADVSSAAYVRDPNGNRTAAQIVIDRTGGRVKVSGTVTNIPNGFQAQEYTLVVPTYVLPTKSDYTVRDDSSVCYTASQSNCIAGNAAEVRKITPAPDKAWVLDAEGALTTSDPGKTNQVGADNKVFAPGSDIGAVVNGSIPANLAENLSSYSIVDDWTAAAKYVDFSDATKARVFVDGLDVTRQFTVSVSGSKTTATANASFLSATKGLAAAKTVKLYVGGSFKLDYDTNGALDRLTNSGAERWNNETVETNAPAVYTVTPNPNKAWVLDEQGGLITVDVDETNQVGADGKVFLQNDAVSAVVNGKIPAGLGQALKSYTITDDWTKAAKYVNFGDVSLAKVFYNGRDVTSGFDVNVVGTKTIATAKAPFLAATAGLAKDGEVKLIITGAFRDDYDTDGKVVELTNSGSESWNGKEIETNSPPVFAWTPDPNKQVLGSTEESGSKGHADINGSSVWPGQKLEYSVGIDLRIPKGTARGVKTFAVEDAFDAHFTPDKASVEFWDTRDASNPKPVARSAYKLVFDDVAHKFTATFTDEWIKKNVSSEGVNDAWLTQGWLTMRFTGTVSKGVPAGSSVVNQAFQIINGGRTATEVPEVKIPTVTPDKESLNTDKIDIDGKTVVAGDVILYRLLLDGGPARDQLAYNVHKFGMVDDYDEEFLELSADDVAVTEKDTGADVTGKFNVQVKDGVAYIFAKTVDTEGVYGGIIPGDPQATDLAAHDAAAIRPLEDAIIDQALLGKNYWVTLRATVTKEKDGHVIENQATQNIQNTRFTTKIVSNPLKDIDPIKDVTVGDQDDATSVNEAEIRMWSQFNYRLGSSEIPANRAYAAKQWSVTDAFNRVHDQYTGIWAVYADQDVFQGDELLFAKGELIQDSKNDAGRDYFTVTFDEATYTLKAEATPAFLALVESRKDLSAAFSVYTKMVRVAPAERIENKVTESYNAYERDSNVVWTITPEFPELDVIKYTLNEGDTDGRRGEVTKAYEMSREELELKKLPEDATDGTAGAEVQTGVEVGIRLSNVGDVPLTNVTLTDLTHQGRHGELEGLVCAVPADPAAPTLIKGDTELAADDNGMIWALPSSITELAMTQVVDCRGTLRGMAPGMTHGDTVVATGESIFTAKAVKAEDAWFAVAPSAPAIDVVKYTLDEGREAGDRNEGGNALELTQDQGRDGVRVAFDVTNTGDEPLTDLSFSDTTHDGTTGQVEGIQWLDPVAKDEEISLDLDQAETTLVAAPAAAGADVTGGAATVTLNGQEFTPRPVEELTQLKVGERALLVGTLTGVEAGTSHGDTATVSALALYSGQPVKDEDPWNAKLAALPPVPVRGAVTGDPFAGSDDKPGLLSGAGLLLLAALTVAYAMRRRARSA